jgi:N utilization substance protein B
MSNPKSKAREYAVQFLYQNESEKLFHFTEGYFAAFVRHFEVPEAIVPVVRDMVRGTLDQLTAIDARLAEISVNWKLSRMAAVDRNVLRLAAFELLESTTPPKVVLNEAIELAKKYGTNDSGSFVNGLLDKLAKAVTDDRDTSEQSNING